MITIDFRQPFRNTDGSELADDNQAHLLGKLLASSPTGDPLKFWNWAVKVTQEGTLELDAADTETLMTFIKTHSQMTNLSKAQLLLAIIKARDSQ